MTYDELADYCKEASNEIIRQDEQIRKLEKENQELKKQLAEQDYTIIPNCDIKTLIDKYKTQQQEFIKYLDDEIERKRFNATCMFEYNDTVLPLKEILQKYKEIIGGNKDE